jgi:hypothetical protein
MSGFKTRTQVNENIVAMKRRGMTFAEISKEIHMPVGTIKTHYYLSTGQPTARVPESPYPRYDDPPEIEGDALIIPDAEIPFHHAEFLNRVLDLADKWGIKKAIWAGDAVHFDSLSGWEPNWTVKGNSGLTETDEKRLLDIAMSLPKNHQQKMIEAITDIGGFVEERGFSGEMLYARKTLAAVNECFDDITWLLGNHESRLMRTINSPLEPNELLNLMNLENGRWQIAPYYYCWLNSDGIRYRICHPKSAGKGAAEQLASKFLTNILMGHSHLLRHDWDKSGQFYAIQMGHCVDEKLLAYASQRDTVRDSHKLGAVIIREGYPYLLHEHINWKRMEQMA